MNLLDVDIEWLEDALAADPPPCEALHKPVPLTCGRPSVAHVHVTCSCCRRSGGFWLCRACLRKLSAQRMSCGACDVPVTGVER